MTDDNDKLKTTLIQNLQDVNEERLLKQTMRQAGTGTLSGKRAVVVQIGDTQQEILLSPDLHCLLGRFPKKKPSAQAIDLSAHDALNNGVSRVHAQFHVEGEHLYLTDLDSTNGTFLHGTQIEPHTPAELHDGDMIILGKLGIQVMFR